MATTELTTTQKAARFLSDYCFREIWNSTHSEYRSNFALTSVAPRYQTGSVAVGNVAITLPTTGQFATFRAGWSLTGGAIFKAPAYQWINAVDVLKQMNTHAFVYTVNGQRIPLGAVYIYYYPRSSCMIVAIDQAAISACAGSAGFNQTFYMTIYRDINLSSNIASRSYIVTAANKTVVMNDITSTSSGFSDQTSIWINGYDFDMSRGSPTLAVGDYVEILIDLQIAGSFISTIDDNVTGYQSVQYAGYRELVHIPKSINSQNRIITHDTITITLRDTVNNRGIYFHRLSPICIKQVTHNDISLDRSVVQSFKDTLPAATVEVRVQVRIRKNSPRVLMTDACFIKDLYINDDATISAFLAGRGDSALPFWTAATIEQSPYIKMMFKNNESQANTLDAFVQGLGYYGTAAILSQNVYSGTYDGSSILIKKPFALQDKTVYPLVFANGGKVLQPYLQVTDRDPYVVINLLPGANVQKGETLSILGLEGGTHTVTRFTSASGQTPLTVSDLNFSVYKEVTGSETSNHTTYTKGYIQVASGSDTWTTLQDGSGYQIIFSPSTYGDTFIVSNTKYAYTYRQNLDAMISNNAPLMVSLNSEANDGTIIPLLGFENTYLYLNGKALVKGIDYLLIPIQDEGGATYAQEFVIMNSSYLQNSGNVLEIIVTPGTETSDDIGYVIGNIMKKSALTSDWKTGVSYAMANGGMIPAPSDYGSWMMPNPSLDTGSLFELVTQFPSTVFDLLSEFSQTQDESRLEAVNTYLNRQLPSYPSIAPITKQHTVYSPFITAVSCDLINGDLEAVYDANDSTFLAQFSDYDYLRDVDPTLSATSMIDRRFVSVAASYDQLPPTSAANTQIIRALISLMLVTSPQVIEETKI